MKVRDLFINPAWSYVETQRYAESLNVTVCFTKLSKGLLGLYDAAENGIVIDRTLSDTQKRCTLVHELIHWTYQDASCDPLFHSKEEKRTRRETAQILINDIQYRVAEDMYDDMFQIARELDVTVQVLQDYQETMSTRVLLPSRQRMSA